MTDAQPFVPIRGRDDWQRAQEAAELERRNAAHVAIVARENQRHNARLQNARIVPPALTCAACSGELTSRTQAIITPGHRLVHTRCRVGVNR
jgi:hypothetical protein